MEKAQKKVFVILILFFVVSCKSTEILENKEQTLIKEKIINSSFDIGGIANKDSVKQELYIWDTIIKRYEKMDTLRTTFNELTKYQTIKLFAMPDTLRDTTYIKTETKTKYIDVIKYIEVVPKWMWWILFIAIAEFLFIIIQLRIKN